MTQTTLKAEEWHHVTMAVAPGHTELNLYVNGTQVLGNNFLHPTSTTTPSQPNDMYIGCQRTSADCQDYFEGHLDEVLFWNSQKEAPFIAQIYQEQKPGKYTLFYMIILSFILDHTF